MSKKNPDYRVTKGKGHVSIIEVTTGLCIERFTNKALTQAKEFCERLNNGAGFQGYTPPFICRT